MRDVANIISRAATTEAAAAQCRRPTNRPRKFYAELKSLRIPAIVATHFQSRLSAKRSARNYFQGLKWALMPDLAAQRNAGQRIGYATVSMFRVHGHALGQSISKFCKPPNVQESCPSCGLAITEDNTHALLSCTYTSALTAEHLPQLMAAMEQAAPAWNRSYRRQDIDQRKMRLILMAPCTPKRPADRRKITGLVHAWLAAIREQHPNFRDF